MDKSLNTVLWIHIWNYSFDYGSAKMKSVAMCQNSRENKTAWMNKKMKNKTIEYSNCEKICPNIKFGLIQTGSRIYY